MNAWKPPPVDGVDGGVHRGAMCTTADDDPIRAWIPLEEWMAAKALPATDCCGPRVRSEIRACRVRSGVAPNDEGRKR